MGTASRMEVPSVSTLLVTPVVGAAMTIVTGGQRPWVTPPLAPGQDDLCYDDSVRLVARQAR